MAKTIKFNDNNSSYLMSKETIGICNDKSKSKLVLMGTNSLNIIKYLSINEYNIEDDCKFVVFYKRRFIDEVLIFKINPQKYILICNNYDLVLQTIKKSFKKFPLTVCIDASMLYSYFTFHGKLLNDYFQSYKLKYLFQISHQGYFYYHLLTSKNDEVEIFNHFISNKFVNISIETKRIFLYNNKVIPNFNKISKKYILELVNAKYCPNDYTVNLYDILDNEVIFKNTKIFNYLGKKVGLVYCSFCQPGYHYYNYEFSKILENYTNQVAIVITNTTDDILYIKKNNKKDVLLKKRL